MPKGIDTPAKRRDLAQRRKPYWRQLVRGLFLGYRRNVSGGKWLVRILVAERQYKESVLPALPDDAPLEANGETVLSYVQAVAKAHEMFDAGKRKEMGIAQPEPSKPYLVREACAEYVTFLKGAKRTGHEAELRLALHVLPKFGETAVMALTTKELRDWKLGLVRRDPNDRDVERASKATANRVMTSFRAALNLAFREDAAAKPKDKKGITSDTAWRVALKPFGAKEVKAKGVDPLDERQIQRLLNTCTRAFKNLVTAALLTGARPPHELATPKVRDFNARLGTLTVTGKTGERDISLTAEAVRFFTDITTGKDPDALLLPKEDGAAWNKNHHVREMQDAARRAKLPKGTTIYRLRHTHASHALMNGMSLRLLAENMGTSVRMLELTYAKFLKKARREQIEAGSLRLGLKRDRKLVSLEDAR